MTAPQVSICRDCSPHCVLLGINTPDGPEVLSPDRCPHSSGGRIDWSHNLSLEDWIAICEQAPVAALVEALKGREGVDAIEIDHTDDYHVIRSDEFDDEIGSLEPVWSDQGPVTLIRIVPKEASE